MSESSTPRRPVMPGARHFEALVAGAEKDDPAVRSEAADRCAALLVRGARNTDDEEVVARVVGLAESEGLEAIADLWAGSPADSLAGCLWRLYLLRAWVHADPAGAAREFDAGRRRTPVHEAVAGVVDPPGPDEVRELTDKVLRGVARGDFADTLWRAAAFARVVSAGRAAEEHPEDPSGRSTYRADLSAARLLALAVQQVDAAGLEAGGHLA